MGSFTLQQAPITGATRLIGMIGDPIAKARSPQTFNPRIATAGRNAVLIPLHLREEEFDEAIDGVMRIANLDGLIITMPFKTRILPRLASVSHRVAHVGAANAARRAEDGSWLGEMFDGIGCLGAIRGMGIDPAGLQVGLVGAGGAGSAIALALAESGVASLRIHDVDADRARDLARRIGEATALTPSAGVFVAGDVELLVNATPVGMKPGDGMPIAIDGLSAATSVVDIIPDPAVTPLLAAAAKVGARHVGGAAMVAAQADAMLDFFGLAAPAG